MNVTVTEDQYLEDLAALFRRYRLRPGSSGALESLSDELHRNPGFRGDLFNLCTAISHMRETDLTPEEMLGLAARAMAGRHTARSAQPAIPSPLRIAFVEEYARWANRSESQQHAFFGRPAENAPEADGSTPDSPPRPETRFSSAASLSGADRRWRDAIETTPEPGPHTPVDTSSQPLTPIGPDTPIGNLTISQLRGYLDEIESRMGRLQPYFDSLRTTPQPASGFAPAETQQPILAGRPEPPVERRSPVVASADPPLLHRGIVRPPESVRTERLRTEQPTATEERFAAGAVAQVQISEPGEPSLRPSRSDVAHNDPVPTEVITAAQPVATSPKDEAPERGITRPDTSTAAPQTLAEKTASPDTEKPISAQQTETAAPLIPPNLGPRDTSKKYHPAENDLSGVLPLRGTSRPPIPPLAPTLATDVDLQPLPVIFRNATEAQPVFRSAAEPESGASGYVLAIVATIILVATTGAAGYRYLDRYQAPTVPLAPAPAPPEPAASDQTVPVSPPIPDEPPTDAGTPPATSLAKRSTIDSMASPVAGHPPRPVSRAIQVEAEAARSEADAGSTAPHTPTTTPAPIVRPRTGDGESEPPATYPAETR